MGWLKDTLKKVGGIAKKVIASPIGGAVASLIPGGGVAASAARFALSQAGKGKESKPKEPKNVVQQPTIQSRTQSAPIEQQQEQPKGGFMQLIKKYWYAFAGGLVGLVVILFFAFRKKQPSRNVSTARQRAAAKARAAKAAKARTTRKR